MATKSDDIKQEEEPQSNSLDVFEHNKTNAAQSGNISSEESGIELKYPTNLRPRNIEVLTATENKSYSESEPAEKAFEFETCKKELKDEHCWTTIKALHFNEGFTCVESENKAFDAKNELENHWEARANGALEDTDFGMDMKFEIETNDDEFNRNQDTTDPLDNGIDNNASSVLQNHLILCDTNTGRKGGRKHSCSKCGKTFFRGFHLRQHEKVHLTGPVWWWKPKHKRKNFNMGKSCLSVNKNSITSRRRNRCGISILPEKMVPKQFSPKCVGRFETDKMEREREDSSPSTSNGLSVGFPCPICKKIFRKKGHMTRHLLTHAPEKPYACDFCLKRFAAKYSLQMHLLNLHNTNSKPFECDYQSCDKRFTLKKELDQHKFFHKNDFKARNYPCYVCDLNFTNKDDLDIHLETHPEAKIYCCSHCDKSFPRKYNLTRHERTHSTEKPYKCDVCNKDFGTKNGLHMHLQAHETDENKPLSCHLCNKRFTVEQNLELHILYHNRSDEQPFSCELCEVRFKSQERLEKHFKTHGSIEGRVFNCQYCEKQFPRKYNLVRHELSHTHGRRKPKDGLPYIVTVYEEQEHGKMHENDLKVKSEDLEILEVNKTSVQECSIKAQDIFKDKAYEQDKIISKPSGNNGKYPSLQFQGPETYHAISNTGTTGSSHCAEQLSEKVNLNANYFNTAVSNDDAVTDKMDGSSFIAAPLPGGNDLAAAPICLNLEVLNGHDSMEQCQRGPTVKKRFACLICEKTFTRAFNFRRHQMSHELGNLKPKTSKNEGVNPTKRRSEPLINPNNLLLQGSENIFQIERSGLDDNTFSFHSQAVVSLVLNDTIGLSNGLPLFNLGQVSLIPEAPKQKVTTVKVLNRKKAEYPCLHCGSTFTMRFNLRQHEQNCRSENDTSGQSSPLNVSTTSTSCSNTTEKATTMVIKEEKSDEEITSGFIIGF